TMISGGGNDTFDGGDGFDTILVDGTPGNDVINVVQTSASAATFTTNGVTQTGTLTSVEQVKIQGGEGNDLIRVSVADALEAAPASSLRFDVDGGPAGGNDRLLINDDGLGDLTILRQAADGRSGSATVGALNPVVYRNI